MPVTIGTMHVKMEAGRLPLHTPGKLMQCTESPEELLMDDRAGPDVNPLVATINTDNTSEEQWRADAARMVRAWNCHDEMLAALKDALKLIPDVYSPHNPDYYRIQRIRDAIAAAEDIADAD